MTIIIDLKAIEAIPTAPAATPLSLGPTATLYAAGVVPNLVLTALGTVAEPPADEPFGDNGPPPATRPVCPFNRRDCTGPMGNCHAKSVCSRV